VVHFVVARDGDGYSQAFAVTASNALYRIWQDPQTTNWQVDAARPAIAMTNSAGQLTLTSIIDSLSTST
jgi:hypothetical protein